MNNLGALTFYFLWFFEWVWSQGARESVHTIDTCPFLVALWLKSYIGESSRFIKESWVYRLFFNPPIFQSHLFQRRRMACLVWGDI